MNDAIDGRIQELTETLQDIKIECKKASSDNWNDCIESILYLCNAALIEE